MFITKADFMKSFSLVLGTGVIATLSLLTACGSDHSLAPTPANSDVAASASHDNADINQDEALGTVWGDEIHSPSQSVSVTYLSDEPIDQSIVRYADKTFQGKSLNSISLHHGKLSLSFVGDDGKTLPIT